MWPEDRLLLNGHYKILGHDQMYKYLLFGDDPQYTIGIPHRYFHTKPSKVIGGTTFSFSDVLLRVPPQKKLVSWVTVTNRYVIIEDSCTQHSFSEMQEKFHSRMFRVPNLFKEEVSIDFIDSTNVTSLLVVYANKIVVRTTTYETLYNRSYL